MDSIIKNYADSGEVDHLRYIFLDSLDVDPTFENYKEELEYCRDIPGLFEPYKELSPLKKDPSEWNDAYWISIKKDLKKNYSLERFEHMKDVAKVVYADKIKRITLERQTRKEEEVRKQRERERVAESTQEIKTSVNMNHVATSQVIEPKSNIKHNTVEFSENNHSQYTKAQYEREKKSNELRIQLDKEREEQNNRERNEYAKKALGTVAVIAVIIVVTVVILTVK